MYETREQWLQAALNLIRFHLRTSASVEVPKDTQVSCGLAGGRIGAKRIGECWSTTCSADGKTEIFISPVLSDITGKQGVLATLVHEAIHAAIGTEHGHKAPFRAAAEAAGLEGKMTATTASDALMDTIWTWSGVLGDYPHSALIPGNRKKQTTRLIKACCAQCGFVTRLTQKWIDKIGADSLQCVDSSCGGSLKIAGSDDDEGEGE
jgi:hypothetical protein